MKYIITKKWKLIDLTKCASPSFFEKMAVKKADTIEELCDVFINTWENGNPSIWYDFQIALGEKKNVQFNVHKELFGAIWTDKGLIYVAKMNEDGELELL